MNISKLLKILILTIFVFPIFFVNAQVDLPSNFPSTSDYLQIKMSPENPGPNQKVLVSLELYITDLKKAQISWFLDGQLQKKDFGLTSFEFTTKSVGQSQKISILINTFEGSEIRKDIILRPADVDIVWNANTYTPPFYKGRALLTGHGNELTVSAIPNLVDTNGVRIDPQALNYEWHKDNTFLNTKSGFGKNSITIDRESIPRPFNIKVLVSTIDGSISAQKTIKITYLKPQVLVYEKHPLYGILFNNAVKESDLENQEITLSAIPYFFSESFKNSPLISYEWKQNGQKILQSSGQNTMTFRKEDNNQKGKVNIEVSVQNRDDFIQTANESVGINLNK